MFFLTTAGIVLDKIAGEKPGIADDASGPCPHNMLLGLSDGVNRLVTSTPLQQKVIYIMKFSVPEYLQPLVDNKQRLGVGGGEAGLFF